MGLSILLVAFLLFVSPAESFAQTSTGSISGVVEDQSKSAVPGVRVTVTNVDTGIARWLMTSADGRYHFAGLIPGSYEAQAELTGFQIARRGVQLTVGSEAVLNLVLAVGGLEENVTVTSERPLVEVVSSTVSGLVDDKTIRELPLNGRSFDQLITLQAAAPMINSRGKTSFTGQGSVFSISGARTQSNTYLMDGTEVIGAGSSTSLPGGVLGTNMGVEAIQEFAVLTSNYGAQYGKRSGGIVNIATRSGTNAFHGSVFEFHRNDALDARDFFDPNPQPPEFSRNQFGAALGGPIFRNRTFFFVNYEGLRESLGLTLLTIVPDENARRGLLPDPSKPGQLRDVGVAPAAAPFMELFPLPNGRNFGDGSAELVSSITQPSEQDFVLARVDHKLSDRDSLFARYNFSRAEVTEPGDNPVHFVDFAKNRDQMLTVETRRASTAFLNTLRFGFTRSNVTSDSQPSVTIDPSMHFLDDAGTIGAITFSTAGAAGTMGATGTARGSDRFFIVNQFDLQEQIAYYRGAHSLQFGVQVQRIVRDEQFGINGRGEFQFADFEQFLGARPTLFRAPEPGSSTAFKAYRQTYFSTYVQDDYRVGRNLTLNLGLRYEVLTSPTEVDGDRISNFHVHLIDGRRVLETEPHVGAPFYNTDFGSIAPRVGFAWAPLENGTLSLRGGIGVFYDQIETEFRAFTANNPPFFSLTEVRNPPFPRGFAEGTGANPVFVPDGVDVNIQPARRLHWNLGIQRQLTRNSAVSANYVGSVSDRLTTDVDLNTRMPVIQADGSPFYPANAPRVNPALGPSRYISSDASGAYNGLQLEFEQRNFKGLRYKVSFSLAKSMDEASATVSQLALGSPSTIMDPGDIERDRGLSSYDVRRNFVSNFIYEVPAGELAGVAGALLGGWQLGGTLTLQDGTPFTVTAGFNRSRDSAWRFADRPNLRAGASSNPVLGGADRYFDTSAFELQPAGYYGNLGRNTLIGPGVVALDASLIKKSTLVGSSRLELRLEVFNVLNRANFGLPNAAVFSPNGQVRGAAGRITQTTTTSRQIQLGAKISF